LGENALEGQWLRLIVVVYLYITAIWFVFGSQLIIFTKLITTVCKQETVAVFIALCLNVHACYL